MHSGGVEPAILIGFFYGRDSPTAVHRYWYSFSTFSTHVSNAPTFRYSYYWYYYSTPTYYLVLCELLLLLILHTFFFHTLLLSSFWTSRGHRCPFFFPPVLAFSFYRA